MSWLIAFTHTEWLEKQGDALALLIRYEKVPTDKVGEPGEASLTTSGTLKVTVTRNVFRNWGFEAPDRVLEAQIVLYAFRFACDQATSGFLEGAVELQLNSYNTAKEPAAIDLEKYYIPRAVECGKAQ